MSRLRPRRRRARPAGRRRGGRGDGALEHDGLSPHWFSRCLGEDERLLRKAGLRHLAVEDATENTAAVAERWLAARATRAGTLREIEGEQTFDGQQRFLEVTARLARERRLSRLVYLAEKPR